MYTIVYMCTPSCVFVRVVAIPSTSPGHHLGLCVAATAGGLSRMSSLELRRGRHAKASEPEDLLDSVRFCKTHDEVIAFNTITLITLTLRTLFLRNGWNGWCRERQSCCDTNIEFIELVSIFQLDAGATVSAAQAASLVSYNWPWPQCGHIMTRYDKHFSEMWQIVANLDTMDKAGSIFAARRNDLFVTYDDKTKATKRILHSQRSRRKQYDFNPI